ncbi:hypothetical protein I3843_12G024700 [Carya illinoinensis]|nr:hypothetical protein I3760_12G024400 [Carya illinoinensis]KAG7951753.1 hypothetical protein I3843_12G024700 [Carya illinoinensis]
MKIISVDEHFHSQTSLSVCFSGLFLSDQKHRRQPVKDLLEFSLVKLNAQLYASSLILVSVAKQNLGFLILLPTASPSYIQSCVSTRKVLEFYFIKSKMSSPSKRREMDVMKLMMSDYTVETINDGLNEFNVEFHGPKESLYEGGIWKVRVELPDAYPYKSPSIGFVNKIYHPNVDELSGSVCLDVINQSWSPMFDLLNVFEVFLPQLLLYPNPSDPLNGDAASLMMKDRKQYDQKVKEYCERYAKRENISNSTAEVDSGDEEISEEESGGSSDDDIAGHADP